MGKSWEGSNRLTPDEVAQACGIFNENIWFVKPEKDFTIDTMLERIRQLKDRHGLDYFVIDAWNKLEQKRGGKSETDFVGETLDKIGVFCEAENIHAFLVVHPVKMAKQKDSNKYQVPGLYDCSGSSHFNNKTDNGITIYRDFETELTHIIVTKVKFSHWGKIGKCEFVYDLNSGRYMDDCSNGPQHSWLPEHAKPIQETPFELPTPSLTDAFGNAYDNSEVPF
jgi:twinkle protein